MASALALTLTACGGGGSGGSGNNDTSSGFSVPSATGGDGLDKVLSLLNVQSQSQVYHGIGGSLTSNRSELTRSVGCSSGFSKSRNDYPQAATITNNSVCIGTECATANNNSLMVTDAENPDIRFDTIFFYGGTVEVASNATLFEAEAGREQACSIDGPTPDADFPVTINGTYKGFVYRRQGDQLNRSDSFTLDCANNECSVEGNIIANDNVTLEPEGSAAPEFIWETIPIKFTSDEAQVRYNAILSASPEGNVLGGVGIPIYDGSTVCSRDCVTIALQRQ